MKHLYRLMIAVLVVAALYLMPSEREINDSLAAEGGLPGLYHGSAVERDAFDLDGAR